MILSCNAFDSHNTSLPLGEPLVQLVVQPQAPLSSEQSTFMSSMPHYSFASQPCYPPPCYPPPFYHSPRTTANICCVNQMNVDQTANWIRTLGFYKGWEEAEGYAQSFREEQITGESLEDLTPEYLEQLTVTNRDHQQELMSTLNQLFEKNRYLIPEQQRSVGGEEIKESLCESLHDGRWETGSDCESSSNYPTSVYDDSDCESIKSYLISRCLSDMDESVQMDHSDTSESSYKWSATPGYIGNVSSSNKNEDKVMSDKPTPEGSSERDAVCVRKARSTRNRKLLLTLQRHQICQDGSQINSIRSRFAELNFDVDVRPREDKPNLYIIVFRNRKKAQAALVQSKVIGYKLLKKYPQRPTPKKPMKYLTMKPLTIRTGKALSGPIVGKLKEGDVVTVNQHKGRRARVIGEMENGQVFTRGWVSVHSSEGVQLLTPLGDL